VPKNDPFPTYSTYQIKDYSRRSHDLLIITIHVTNLKFKSYVMQYCVTEHVVPEV